MRRERIAIWLTLMLTALGLLLVIPALWVFVSVTATPLYPNPENVPAVMLAEPSPKWAGAAEQGRQIVRKSVAEQNLPGLSVAAGIDGEIVWAEGFGFADLKTSVPVESPVQDRYRFHSAHFGCGRPAAGEWPAEA